jgi:hypothetical protein
MRRLLAGCIPPDRRRPTMTPFGARDYCPWQHLGDLDGVAVLYHRDGEAGVADFESRTVSLRLGMSGAQRRVTLAHELIHLERGPACEGATARVDELLVEASAALRLIPATVLADLPALVAKHGRDAAAEFLAIDDHLLAVALSMLRAA